jgi:hypothetical protein
MKARSSLIAEKDPFVVISLLFRGYGDQNKFTPQIGDYAAVIHEGKIYPAICGDYGPSFKMGEASLLMAKTVNPKATPYIRPESDLKVTYLIFPGTAEKAFSARSREMAGEMPHSPRRSRRHRLRLCAAHLGRSVQKARAACHHARHWNPNDHSSRNAVRHDSN